MKQSSYKGHVWIDQKIYFEFQTKNSVSPEQFVQKLQSLKSEEIDGLFAAALKVLSRTMELRMINFS